MHPIKCCNKVPFHSLYSPFKSLSWASRLPQPSWPWAAPEGCTNDTETSPWPRSSASAQCHRAGATPVEGLSCSTFIRQKEALGPPPPFPAAQQIQRSPGQGIYSELHHGNRSGNVMCSSEELINMMVNEKLIIISKAQTHMKRKLRWLAFSWEDGLISHSFC